uniref:Interphotoreceptor matrix proteoglycan 1 n=1 Tax=Salarias fasciatus TaxID=181472 RepID=A0A672FT30_SALFA
MHVHTGFLLILLHLFLLIDLHTLCQEAVWEAFRIFFDRIPGTVEYQHWVRTCQQESLCISDLAKNFSASEEHLSLVHRVRGQVFTRELRLRLAGERLTLPGLLPGGRGFRSVLCGYLLWTGDHIVASLLQMQHAFDKLPGFKAIDVLGISEPAVVVIDEDLEVLQDGAEGRTGVAPAAPEEVEAVQDLTVELDHTDVPAGDQTPPPEEEEEEEEGSAFPPVWEEPHTVTAPPPLRYLTTPTATTASHGRELVVFFSLRVTNMDFSEDLFNKTSSEYRSLENTFMDLLMPYLQANLTGFKKLEILNFRKGSVVVNSKMKFSRSVPYNITEAVQCVLEEFCSDTAKNLHIHIDTRSLDVEPADQADPCKFLACDASSRCVLDGWTREARCLCQPGFASTDGLPCQSVCVLQPDFCPAGECHVVPGLGAERTCLLLSDSCPQCQVMLMLKVSIMSKKKTEHFNISTVL